MNAVENKKLMREIFDEMAKGNVRALGAALAEDVQWTFPGNWSWSGSWGPKSVALTGLLRPLMAQFNDYRCEADFMVAEADRVVVQARAHGTTTQGEAYPQTYCFIFRLVDGRISEIIEHCDTALVERVLQPLAR
jgi:ketosteroid isomerase-like protein